MKKSRLIKLGAFLFAIIVCMSLSAPAALAANDTSAASSTAAATESAAPTTPAPTDAEIAIAQYKTEVLRLVNVEREKVGVADLK